MLTLNRVLLGGLIVTCFFVAATLFWTYHIKQDTKAREAALNKQLKETREAPQLGEHVSPIAETPKVQGDDASIPSTQPGHPTFSLETWDRVETMYTTDPTDWD